MTDHEKAIHRINAEADDSAPANRLTAGRRPHDDPWVGDLWYDRPRDMFRQWDGERWKAFMTGEAAAQAMRWQMR